MVNMTTRNCPACSRDLPETSFRQISINACSSVCFSCEERIRRHANPEKARRKAAHKRQRHPDAAIMQDCKKADKKYERPGFDLDRNFIRSLIEKPCSYCGGFEIRMTLDRIDNNLAHMKSNVVPACIRCNYIRNSMPYEAWTNIIPAIRDTFEKGLFGEWKSKALNIKHPVIEGEYSTMTREESLAAANNARSILSYNHSERPRSPKELARIGKSKFEWPSDEELEKEVAATSLRVVANRLGCSHVQVGKRLGRYRRIKGSSEKTEDVDVNIMDMIDVSS